MLSRPDGSQFAVGQSSYLDQDPGSQSETSRINVTVEFEGLQVIALLERVRFAVDPQTNAFLFGPLD